MSDKPRKGASKTADIPPKILKQLNKGTIESATLVEGLAVDFNILLKSAFPEIYKQSKIDIDKKLGITKRMMLMGNVFYDTRGLDCLADLQAHQSDTVRGWGAYVIGAAPDITLKKRLSLMAKFADDSHFGVREWSWLALRSHIVDDPEHAIELLKPWIKKKSSYLRRFAIEAIRPRGVWCPHIEALKDSPELALPLLDPLKIDPERYVQDSVANWLNDASKTQAPWVRKICAQWRDDSDSEVTTYITKRALRSL